MRRAALTRWCGLAILLVLCAALSACGSKHDVLTPGAARPFTVVLDFFPNADHAALYSAITRGDSVPGALGSMAE